MRTILLLGDSLTEFGYASGWSSRLCDAYIRRADVLNRGLCGYNTRWVLQLLHDPATRRELLPHTAHHALFATLLLGANDCANNDQAVEVGEFKRNLAAIARLVLEDVAPQGGLFLLTPPPVDQQAWNAAKGYPRDSADRTLAQTARYRTAVMEVVQQLRDEEGKSVHLVDLHEAVVQYKGEGDDKQSETGGGKNNDERAPWKTLFNDGLHFNETGGRLLYETLMKAIAASPEAEKILPEKIPQMFPAWDSLMAKKHAFQGCRRMWSRTPLWLLKARPKTVSVEPGSNRLLPPALLEKAKDIFAIPVFPNKLVLHNWRFFIKAGKATTGPPVGQEFSKLGLKAMDFAKNFNDRTKPHFKDDVDLIVRVQVYFDKTYNYRIEPPPTAWFLLRAIRKKRGQSGPVTIKGHYCALLTLEMCYEIAKMKQMLWNAVEYPPIEDRVRRIVHQARRMGIAIIGVDTAHSSPVKGMTEKAYLAECAKYRKIHMEQYEQFKQKELESAPLIERLHRPNMSPLSNKQLEEGLQDANLFNALWHASHPESVYMKDLQAREVARRYMNTRGWFAEMTAEEMRVVFLNYRLPAAERTRQNGAAAEMSSDSPQQEYWTRDSPIT